MPNRPTVPVWLSVSVQAWICTWGDVSVVEPDSMSHSVGLLLCPMVSVKFLLHLFVCAFACVCVCRSLDNFQESVISYPVSPRDGTQVVRLGSNRLYS